MIERRRPAMWIKICGMTTPEAIEAALAARVDAIGFVFSPSSRRLTPQEGARLAAPARGRVPCVAVTRHPTQELLDEIVAAFAPDVWQSDLADVAALRVPEAVGLLPVMRSRPAGPAELPARALPAGAPPAGAPPAQAPAPEALPLQALPARLLFEGPTSGSGLLCDWTSARALAERTELILAGGLDAETVGAAIEAVAPFGVDVSSGVEERPGVKSPEKILRFVEAARAAVREATRESARESAREAARESGRETGRT